MLSSIHRVCAFAILLLFITVAAASAQTDVVTTTTGERLVGEIKKLEKDVLTMSTGYSDSDFKIEWDKVASIESPRQFLLETFDGSACDGPLKTDPAKKAAVEVGASASPWRMWRPCSPSSYLLVQVRRGFRFRLQHDAGELGQAAHGRRQPAVSGQAGHGYGAGQRVQQLPVQRAGNATVGSRE